MTELEGRKVGPWTLGGQLGEGGNAIVWEAWRHPADQHVALKVLKSAKVGKEPYKRFVREIQFLRSMENLEGILPLLDANLPDRPTRADPAWLAMPIAVPIEEAIKGEPLEQVVEAVSQIATTLARLHAEGIAHRDIKPGNLYEWRDLWVVGDFGLVAIPDMAELTRNGRPVGPAHFMPYEMIVHAGDADPMPADVYSLAKTLWVLVTRQRFPPEGHQPAGTRQLSMADLRPHALSDRLDVLVDRCTNIHPEMRPPMSEIAADLKTWRELSAEVPPFDVSEIAAKFRAGMAEELSEEEIQTARKEQAYAAIRRLQELTGPLNEALASVRPGAELDRHDDKQTQNLLRTFGHMGASPVAFRWQRCSRIWTGPGHHRFVLKMSRSLELLESGELVLRTMVDVEYEGITQTEYHWRSEERTAPVGGIQAEKILEDGVAELADKLKEGVKTFVHRAVGEESPKPDS
jgi:serine/threonine protein kinase